MFGVANIKNIDSLGGLVDPKNDAMGLEKKLPKALLQVFSLSGEPAARGKAFQCVDLVVELLEPARGVERSAFVNVFK